MLPQEKDLVINYDMKMKLKIALFLMILSSLFVGINIKGWVFLYEFEIGLFKPLLIGNQYGYAVVSVLVVLSHVLIFCLPFLTQNRHFKKILIVVPIIFAGSFSITSGAVFFLLIPFIIFWIIALYFNKSTK